MTEIPPDCDITSCPAQQLTYLQEAAHHMIPEHGQTGSALAVHVDGVDRHDDGLWLCVVRHQDADPAVAEANRVVCHPEEKKPFNNLGCGVKGQESEVEAAVLTWGLGAHPGGPGRPS